MRTCLILLIWLGPYCVFCQKANQNVIDQYLDSLGVNNQLMGSVSILQNEEIVYSKSVGYASFESKTPNTNLTRYRIGSITKTFTAVLTLMAVEEKKISLSQSIERFFPNIKDAFKIQIQHLLSHRSGVHNFTDNEDFGKWYQQTKSRKEMLAIITNGSLDFEVGSKSSYSNSNYVLLTFILEETYQKPFEEILHDKIITKLSLKNTYYGHKIDPTKYESYSYRFLENRWIKQPETDMSIPLGAGGIVSTSSDVALFVGGLFGGRLVSHTALSWMTNTENGFGFGIFKTTLLGTIAYQHTGDIDGFGSIFTYLPSQNRVLVLATNGYRNYNEFSERILKKLIQK